MLDQKIPPEDNEETLKARDAERRRRPADLSEAFRQSFDPVTMAEPLGGVFYSMKDKIPRLKK